MSQQADNRWQKWARLRFSIIGPLLTSPPKHGQLRAEFEKLAKKRWQHPTKEEESTCFSVSTLERWYYRAKNAQNPVEALLRRVRADADDTRVMTEALLVELQRQYQSHPSWSVQLHYDNLQALVAQKPELGPLPCYATVRRQMQTKGWLKRKSLPLRPTAGQEAALNRIETREVRSYEVDYIHALWHCDFHKSRLRIVDNSGIWHTPIAFAVLDDRSRLVCHIQWYLSESAENLIHGLCQAFAKRGLPRALMSDNGSAMVAEETTKGLFRLGIEHRLTLAYSPYQNGKQEVFWAQLEGRLMAMLEHVDPLTLSFLNQATQAWAELEYNKAKHDSLEGSPLQRLLDENEKKLNRPAPDSQQMRLAFTRQKTRVQRQSDGTISVQGVRFELPSRLRVLRKVQVRYQSWDLGQVWVVDPKTGHVITQARPLDKSENSDAKRRLLHPADNSQAQKNSGVPLDPIPPRMQQLLIEYAATGCPPAYLPKDESKEKNDD